MFRDSFLGISFDVPSSAELSQSDRPPFDLPFENTVVLKCCLFLDELSTF
ncbi:MAG: hypothetical protein LBC20_09540 [Planctomycetaceae bacterium]|nr:hypothetical protein [Planctomycetaceae bacterium]